MGATATSTNRIQVYPYDRIFSRTLNRLKSATDISESDKADIIKMIEHLQTRGISKLRAAKYIYHLIVLARTAGKPLRQLEKAYEERLVGWINASNYAEETKHGYKVALKKFYQWLRGCDEEEHEYPEEVR